LHRQPKVFLGLRISLFGTLIVFGVLLLLWYFTGINRGPEGLWTALALAAFLSAMLFFISPSIAKDAHGSNFRIRESSVVWQWGASVASVKLRDVKYFRWIERDGYLILSLARYDDKNPFEAAVPEGKTPDLVTTWWEAITATLLEKGITVKVNCTRCGSLSSAIGAIWKEGWAACETCGQLFPLVEVFPSFCPPPAPGQGAAADGQDAKVAIENSGQELTISAPTPGMSGMWKSFFGALKWLLWTLFFGLIALGLVQGRPRTGVPFFLFSCFLIVCWVIGLGQLVKIFVNAATFKAVRFDSARLITMFHLMGWLGTEVIALERVRCARPCRAKIIASPKPYSVEIIWDTGAFLLPGNSPYEQRRILKAINDWIARFTSSV
jgi:hypothetical protein